MFARTERLLLRPGWAEDAPALATLLADGTVARNLLHMPSPYGVNDAERFLALPRAALLPDFLIFKRTRGAPRLIGGCGMAEADWGVEVGYWIARPYWGLGFATEALHALIGVARACGHGTIHGRHFIDNPASGRVLAKAGFRPTGIIRPAYSLGRGASVAAIHLVHDGTANTGNDGEADALTDMVYRDAA